MEQEKNLKDLTLSKYETYDDYGQGQFSLANKFKQCTHWGWCHFPKSIHHGVGLVVAESGL